MKITYSVLDATKAGSQRAEMEDAAYPDLGPAPLVAAFSCAVADGATQGSHSGPWARLLCEEFVNHAGPTPAVDALDAVVVAARQRFVAWERQYVSRREGEGRPLQWFEAEVIDGGAFATLVGLTVQATAARAAGDGELPAPAEGSPVVATFRALAIGDSCLFVVRDGRVALSFPLDHSAQFAGAPLLVASRADANGQMLTGLRHIAGELGSGDRILICTDALAAWIMREKEQGADPLAQLLPLAASGDAEAFAAFLAQLRGGRKIRNDDVTVAQLVVEA